MSDALVIYINRSRNGWESNIWRGGEQLGVCTAPNFDGVVDLTYEIITDNDPEWVSFNANN